MWVAGVDGCRGGWISFKIHLPSLKTTVELIDLAILAIDVPVGLLDGSRACDKAARRLLGQPRGTSVFAAPCRAALSATNHAAATGTNLRITGRGLSQQAWGIAPKIKQVDAVITSESQKWAFEVHPEVCFWALAGKCPTTHRKKTEAGIRERLALLRPIFGDIDRHLSDRPQKAGKDDLIDAAGAAWTALRICKGEAHHVCEPERDVNGLEASIWY